MIYMQRAAYLLARLLKLEAALVRLVLAAYKRWGQQLLLLLFAKTSIIDEHERGGACWAEFKRLN